MPKTASATAACIMIVEDEPKLAALLADYLHASGYRTVTIGNGLEVIGAVRQSAPDLVLLDVMLPGKDGIEICRELRSFSHVPVIMVTARVEEIDRLLGLEIGADDYVCKPFSPREVVARVQAMLRRAGYGSDKTAAPSGLVMDEATHEATLNGQILDLTPVEFRLLKTLCDNEGRVFSRDQLMSKVYSDYRVVTDRTVDTHIKNLRRKLDQVSPDHELIHSIYGLGYRFER
ncbi:response regulator [Janthinobacterium sp. 17J80-10]|uniref:response regulator n=1 Tax=Janthinobacterium sp. 17J80-10 TaxID=2497863 RepID=UPI0010053925|nr:response regulator [Janthinobacterium sp. 17J80-10]QAU32963.1 response regulator [Janthinobacterium sp. 17J80-10]